MSEKQLIERLVEGAAEQASHVEIFAVRQYSLEEMTRRAKRLLAAVGEVCHQSLDRGDWVQQQDRTLVRLPMGGRGVIYHASGAMHIATGLAPMEHLFAKPESPDALTALVARAAERLRVDELVGTADRLVFERLWQIKARAADRNRASEPVLCRAIGAYRHMAGKLPVLGAASVAVKVAAGGALDSIAVQVRETTGEATEWAEIIRPEDAARAIVAQLASLMGRAKTPFSELARPEPMRLGYVALGKRQAQRVLAPHYVAQVAIEGEEAQAYQLLVPATEKTYLPLCLAGHHAPALAARRAA